MNVSILMCEEWNPSWARKTIVGVVGKKKKIEGGKRSAVKTRQMPDKVLVFCVRFMQSPDPENLEKLEGLKNNSECETSATDRRRETDTDPEIVLGCVSAHS